MWFHTVTALIEHSFVHSSVSIRPLDGTFQFRLSGLHVKIRLCFHHHLPSLKNTYDDFKTLFWATDFIFGIFRSPRGNACLDSKVAGTNVKTICVDTQSLRSHHMLPMWDGSSMYV